MCKIDFIPSRTMGWEMVLVYVVVTLYGLMILASLVVLLCVCVFVCCAIFSNVAEHIEDHWKVYPATTICDADWPPKVGQESTSRPSAVGWPNQIISESFPLFAAPPPPQL